MKQFTPSDMKHILHSKRANMYYLEHCRILVNGGRVEYLTQSKSAYWNIPIANTTVVLLGNGSLEITRLLEWELADSSLPHRQLRK